MAKFHLVEVGDDLSETYVTFVSGSPLPRVGDTVEFYGEFRRGDRKFVVTRVEHQVWDSDETTVMVFVSDADTLGLFSEESKSEESVN